MSRGNFEAGLEAMGAFESGKPSGDPEQYRVQNTLGFTGKYQFGEALLIDLGYYEADTFYGAGAATNLWQGTWTGKAQAFGVNDIEDFRNSPEIQEAAIRDAFEFNWDIIERNLGNAGKDIDDFIGETISFDDGGTQKSVTITPFGILAGAHLRGPYGLSNLLLNGQVSQDEYGTSILRYVDEYAGYDVPEDITGGSVSNPPIDVPDNPTEPVDLVDPGSGNPPSEGSLIGTDGVEDVFDFTWEWGQNAEIAQFNPQEDTINLKPFWLPDSQQVSISDDSNGNAVIDLTEVNNQTITLEGVSKSELTASNFEGLPDASTVLGNSGEPDNPTEPVDPVDPEPDNPTEPVDPVDPGSGNPSSEGSLIGTDGVEDVFDFTWEWGQNAQIAQFNPQEDAIDLKPFWLPDSQQVSISDDSNGNAVIDLTEVNNQTITLEGVSKAELTANNFEGLPDADAVLDNSGEPNSPNPDTPSVPQLTIDTTSVEEGDSGRSNAVFTVELSASSEQEVTVDYNTVDGNADSVTDFVAKSGTLTFAPGETSKTISIEVKGDTEVEKSENFYVELEGAVNADILDNRGDATIINDDRDSSTPTDPTNPPTNPSDSQTIKVNENGADILNFNPASDTIDFGNYSVHSMIITETSEGVSFTSPWNNAEQTLVGVSMGDLSIKNFEPINNSHLREDVSGALAWSRGEAAIEPNTVYVRSHEVGLRETVDFDPSSDKISFLYYGNRETLEMNDTSEGVEISTAATNQSLVLKNVRKADLTGSNFEFHFSQIREDDLDGQLGFDVSNDSIVGREGIPIPGGGGSYGSGGGSHNHSPEEHSHSSMMMSESNQMSDYDMYDGQNDMYGSTGYEDADRLSFQAGGSPTINESEMDNLMVSPGYDLNILGNSGDTNTNLPTDGDDLIEVSSGLGSGNGFDYKSGTDNLFFEDEEFAVLGNTPSYASDASEYPMT